MVFDWSDEVSLDTVLLASLRPDPTGAAGRGNAAAVNHDGEIFFDDKDCLDRHGCNKVASSKRLLEVRRLALTFICQEAEKMRAEGATRDFAAVFTRLSRQRMEKVELACQTGSLNPTAHPSHQDVLFLSASALAHVEAIRVSNKSARGAAATHSEADDFRSPLHPQNAELVDTRAQYFRQHGRDLQGWAKHLHAHELTRDAVQYTTRVVEFMLPHFVWVLGPIPNPHRFGLNFSDEDVKSLYYGDESASSPDPPEGEGVSNTQHKVSAVRQSLENSSRDEPRSDSDIASRLPSVSEHHRSIAFQVHEMLFALDTNDTKLRDLFAQHHATLQVLDKLSVRWSLAQRLLEYREALAYTDAAARTKGASQADASSVWRLRRKLDSDENVSDLVSDMATKEPVTFIRLAFAVYCDRGDMAMANVIKNIAGLGETTNAKRELFLSVHAVYGASQRGGVLNFDRMIDDVVSALTTLRAESQRCYAAAGLAKCWPVSTGRTDVRKLFIPKVGQGADTHGQMLHVAAYPPGAVTLVDIGLRLDGLYDAPGTGGSGVAADADSLTARRLARTLRWETKMHSDAKQRQQDLRTFLLQEIRGHDDSVRTPLQLEGHLTDHNDNVRHLQIRFRDPGALHGCPDDEALKPFQVRMDNIEVTSVNVAVVQATDSKNGRVVPYLRLAMYRTDRHVHWNAHEHKHEVSETAAILSEVLELEQQLAERHKSGESEWADGAVEIESTPAYRISPSTRRTLPFINAATLAFWERCADGPTRLELLELFKGDKSLLFVTAAEYSDVAHTLFSMQHFVEPMHIDAQSCDAKVHRLRALSKQPAMHFVHLIVDGHLERASVDKILALVKGTALKVVMCVSTESLVFPLNDENVIATANAKSATVITNTCTYSGPLGALIDSCSARLDAILSPLGDPYLRYLAELSLNESSRRATAFDAVRDHFNAIAGNAHTEDSRPKARVFFVSTKSTQLSAEKIRDRLSHAETWTADSVSATAITKRILSTVEKRQSLVVIVDTVQLEHLVVPTPLGTVFPTVVRFEVPLATPEALLQSALKSVALERDGQRLVELMTSEPSSGPYALFHALRDAGVDTVPSFPCFVEAVPLCELLDQRARVDLYMRTFLGEFLTDNDRQRVLQSLNNVHTHSLWAGFALPDTRVADVAAYTTSQAGTAVRNEDILRSAVQRYQELDWSALQRRWHAQGFEYSEAFLLRLLCGYHHTLKLLAAVGPGLFHTLESAQVRIEGKAVPWAAKLLCCLNDEGVGQAIALARSTKSTVQAVDFVGALRWILLVGGASSCITADDIVSVDGANIVLDIGAEAMSTVARAAALRGIVSIDAAPSLFAKQARLRTFFSGDVGSTERTLLSDELPTLLKGGPLGASFLGLMLENAMPSTGALRQLWPAADAFWRWYHESSPEVCTTCEDDIVPVVECFTPKALAHAFTMVADRPASVDVLCRTVRQLKDLSLCSVMSVLQELSDGGGETVASRLANTRILRSCTREEEAALDVRVLYIERQLRAAGSASELFEQFQLRALATATMEAVNAEVDPSLLEAFANTFVPSQPEYEVPTLPSLRTAVDFFEAALTPGSRAALLSFMHSRLQGPSLRGDVRAAWHFGAVAVWFLQPMTPITPLDVNDAELLCAVVEAIDAKTEAAKRFVAQVSASVTSASPIAACLAGHFHVVPHAVFKAVADAGGLRTQQHSGTDGHGMATVLLTDMKNADHGQFPPYLVLYPRHRALPTPVFKELFGTPGNPVVYDTPTRDTAGYAVSQGVSRALIRRNLCALVSLRNNEDVDVHFGRLLILLWFRCLGLEQSRIAGLFQRSDHRDAVTSGLEDTIRRVANDTGPILHRGMRRPVAAHIDVRLVQQSPFRVLFRLDSAEDRAYTFQVLASGVYSLPAPATGDTLPELDAATDVASAVASFARITGARLAEAARRIVADEGPSAALAVETRTVALAALSPAISIWPTDVPLNPAVGMTTSRLRETATSMVRVMAESAVAAAPWGSAAAEALLSALVMSVGFLADFAHDWLAVILYVCEDSNSRLAFRVWQEANHFFSNEPSLHDLKLRLQRVRKGDEANGAVPFHGVSPPFLSHEFLNRPSLVNATSSEALLNIGAPANQALAVPDSNVAPQRRTIFSEATRESGGDVPEPIPTLPSDSGQLRDAGGPLRCGRAVDVSALIEFDCSDRFYAPVSVTKGFDVFLVEDARRPGTLVFVSVVEKRRIVAKFPDHGVAWRWCLSLPYPSALIAGGFCLSKEPNGAGWRGLFGNYPRALPATQDEAVGSPTTKSDLADSTTEMGTSFAGSSMKHLAEPRVWHLLAFGDVLCIDVPLTVRKYAVLACRCILAAVAQQDRPGVPQLRVMRACGHGSFDFGITAFVCDDAQSCTCEAGEEAENTHGSAPTGEHHCPTVFDSSKGTTLCQARRRAGLQRDELFRIVEPSTEDESLEGVRFRVERVPVQDYQAVTEDATRNPVPREGLEADTGAPLPEIMLPADDVYDSLHALDDLSDVDVVQLLCQFGDVDHVRRVAAVVQTFFINVLEAVHRQRPSMAAYTTYCAEVEGVAAMVTNAVETELRFVGVDMADASGDDNAEATTRAQWAFMSLARDQLRNRMHDSIRNLLRHGSEDAVRRVFDVSQMDQLGTDFLCSDGGAYRLLRQFSFWLEEQQKSEIRRSLDNDHSLRATDVSYRGMPKDYDAWAKTLEHERFAAITAHKLQAAKRDETLAMGHGCCEADDDDDIVFCVAPALFQSSLQLVFVRRPDAFDPTQGQAVGFLVDQRPLRAGPDVAPEKLSATQQQRKTWLVDVLRAPLSESWKRYLVQHAFLECIAQPQPDSPNFVVPKALADRHEDPKVRSILIANLHQPKEKRVARCTRKNRMYGVIACGEPNLYDWDRQGVKYAVDRVDVLEPMERQYRQIIRCFGPATTHVVVRGLETIPDLMLKWCCEYTVRYPWRFILLIDCLTVDNLPENRDRVQSFIAINNNRIIQDRIPVEFSHADAGSFASIVASARLSRVPAAEHSTRHFAWSEMVRDFVTNFQGKARVLHLVSEPGAGKSHLMEQLRNEAETTKTVNFFFLDCSDDRFVEEALVSLAEEALRGGRPDQRCVFVADEYHMLRMRKKYELVEWIAPRLDNMKLVMIANRTEDHDDDVLGFISARVPGALWSSADGNRSLEARISTSKIYEALGNVTLPLDPERRRETVSLVVVLFATVRTMLSDGAVSLRLLEKFDLRGTYRRDYWVDPVAQWLSDKLLRFGRTAPERIVMYFRDVWNAVYDPNPAAQQAAIIRQLAEALQGRHPPLKLLVIVAMLQPMLLYRHDDARALGVKSDRVERFDRALTLVELTKRTDNAFRAHPLLRLAMWVEHTVEAARLHVPEVPDAAASMDTVLTVLRRLRIVDQTDFPIVLDERGSGAGLRSVESVYKKGDDLTDLDWIIDRVKRGQAVNWRDIKLAWAANPVTNGAKLHTIMKHVPPSVVFDSLSTRNVMQLLRKSADIRDDVVSGYPTDRIAAESADLFCPFYYALWSAFVTQPVDQWEQHLGSGHQHWIAMKLDDARYEPLPTPREAVGRAAKLASRVLAFFEWVGTFGAIATEVPDEPVKRGTRLLSALATLVPFLPADEDRAFAPIAMRSAVKVMSSRFFAPLIDPTAPEGPNLEMLVHTARACSPAVDLWPLSMRRLHSAVHAAAGTGPRLSAADATALVTTQDLFRRHCEVPVEVAAALFQCVEAGYLEPAVQKKLVQLDACIDFDDLAHLNDAVRNVRSAISDTEVAIEIRGTFGDLCVELRGLVQQAKQA